MNSEKKEQNSISQIATIQDLLKIIVNEIEDTKGLETVILDLAGKVSYTDYFVLVTGSSDRHVQAIADRITLKLKKDYRRMAISIEGYQEAQWILLDYGDVVIHVFLSEARDYYDLESIWKDVKRIPVEEILNQSVNS